MCACTQVLAVLSVIALHSASFKKKVHRANEARLGLTEAVVKVRYMYSLFHRVMDFSVSSVVRRMRHGKSLTFERTIDKLCVAY